MDRGWCGLSDLISDGGGDPWVYALRDIGSLEERGGEGMEGRVVVGIGRRFSVD